MRKSVLALALLEGAHEGGPGELVTNAYVHSSGECSLRLRDAGRNRVRLSVRDTNPHIPTPFRWSAEAPKELAERGRGLYLVTVYAESWGAYDLVHDWQWRKERRLGPSNPRRRRESDGVSPARKQLRARGRSVGN
ncbi:ATP-binding protein [Streptomyces sp. NPDC001282]|uniref:ATP-binding protein n=1 Tax=Streptomyces sp. NPDC001282 TaxID=3364557 RepID=UPI00367D608E